MRLSYYIVSSTVTTRPGPLSLLILILFKNYNIATFKILAVIVAKGQINAWSGSSDEQNQLEYT